MTLPTNQTRSDTPLPAMRRVVAAWFLLVCLFAGPFAAHAADPSAAPEPNVKAGFLMAFTQHTTWPSNTFAAADSPIVIGVIGGNRFRGVLEPTAKDQRSVRPIIIRYITKVEEALECQVVFITREEKDREEDILQQLRGKPVLTVGESGQTLARGGVVEFVADNKRIRFDASIPAITQAGLKLGSDMLGSARTVIRTPPAGIN